MTLHQAIRRIRLVLGLAALACAPLTASAQFTMVPAPQCKPPGESALYSTKLSSPTVTGPAPAS